MSTHIIPFLNIKKNIPKDLFQGTQERVRNSRGKRAISVRATEVLLYIYLVKMVQQLKTHLQRMKKLKQLHRRKSEPKEGMAVLVCTFKLRPELMSRLTGNANFKRYLSANVQSLP